MFEIERVEHWVLRAPVEKPVRNSFGVLHERKALFLRLTSTDGDFGWGEVFCNFPQVGAEHRARLIDSIFKPLLVDLSFEQPQSVRGLLEQRTHKMTIQCGEFGPFAQIIAAIDQAVWDMAARRAKVPLWRMLGGASRDIRVYASGVEPSNVEETVLAQLSRGHRAFKLKVGFDAAGDIKNLERIRTIVDSDVRLMADANQAWLPETAIDRIANYAPFNLTWIEEPIAADNTAAVWQAIAAASAIPIAAGENLRGEEQFFAALECGYLSFIQPDVGKWGGISGCSEVARKAATKDIPFCPHWFGGGIGLAVSMQLVAAFGFPCGYLELDINDNKLRDCILPLTIERGHVALPDACGIGIDPDVKMIESFVST